MTIYEFDRYINGQLMAEGVTIEKAKTLDAATAAAARIASKGPKGEAPVLVLRREPAAEAHLTALLRAEYERGVREAAATISAVELIADASADDTVPNNFAEGTSAAFEAVLALLTQEGR